MFKPVVSFKYTLPSERLIAGTLEMLGHFCLIAEKKMAETGDPFIMPTISRIPELTPGQKLNVLLLQRGTAWVDECLMFLMDQKALFAGPLLAALLAPKVLPLGLSCVSFGSEEIDYYGVEDDTMPPLIVFEREASNDARVYFCTRERGWKDSDYFLSATLDNS